ncbi:MAG: NAD-dependent epimerase/dehydratase family protein [bacterium]|nr:NAD-dependent epimerase/dehydratase family protein [bacterium]
MKLKSKTICITGIGGFIGRRVAQLARERGMSVRGLDANPERARVAQDEGATVIVGDLLDETRLAEAVQGSDIVLHTAAIVREGGKLDEFRRVNVEGSVLVARKAREAGARAMVHLSSVMVYGFRFPPDISEEGPYRGEGNPYCMTKIESESALLEENTDPANFGIVIIRPGDVYGPGSEPWIVRPLELMRKGLFSLVDGGRPIINHTYVDNLADGIFLALEKEAWGEAFNITDGMATTMKEFYTRLAKMAGLRPPRIMPAWLVKLSIRFVNIFETILRRPHIALPGGVEFIRRPHAYSIEKAHHELRYRPQVSLDQGLENTKAWLKSQALIS